MKISPANQNPQGLPRKSKVTKITPSGHKREEISPTDQNHQGLLRKLPSKSRITKKAPSRVRITNLNSLVSLFPLWIIHHQGLPHKSKATDESSLMSQNHQENPHAYQEAPRVSFPFKITTTLPRIEYASTNTQDKRRKEEYKI